MPQASGRRKNVLLIVVDQWRAECLSFLGHPSVRTPNIDSLCAEGVTFRNAFVNAPSCTPCRSSLTSGQYFFRTGMGAILLGAKWDAAIPTFPLLLKDAGYHIGKSHKVWSPGTPVDAPYGGQVHAYEKAGPGIGNFSDGAKVALANGKTVEEYRRTALQQVRSGTSSCSPPAEIKPRSSSSTSAAFCSRARC